jgi:DNA-binding MarR family transcriptional regulator
LWKLIENVRSSREAFGITRPKEWANLVRFLSAFFEEKPYSTTEISKNSNVRLQTTSEALKRMEKQGIITRTRSSEDERVTIVQLTDKGKKMRRKIVSIRTRELKNIFQKLDEKEFSEFINATSKVVGLMKKII